MKHTLIPLSLCVAWAFAVDAHSATILVTPSGAGVTSVLGSPELSGRTIGQTIDSSGLSGGGLSGDVLSETHGNESATVWEGREDAVVTYTLSEAFDISGVHIWADIFTRQRSPTQFDIAFSGDNVSYTTAFTVSGFVQDPAINDVQTQTFSLQKDIQYIRLSNFSPTHAAAGKNWVGLSEIRFEATVPEPSIALLSVLGMLLLLRRRRCS